MNIWLACILHEGMSSRLVILMQQQNRFHSSEYCASVEAMFSLEYMYAILGEPAWADLAEKIAYNAVPAQVCQTNSPNSVFSPDVSVIYRAPQTGGRSNISSKRIKFGSRTGRMGGHGRRMGGTATSWAWSRSFRAAP